MRKSQALQKVQNGANWKDVVEIDVSDETREREVADLTECSNSSANTCDEVRSFEGRHICELGVDCSDETRFRNFLCFVFSGALKRDDCAILSSINPRLQKLSYRGEVIQVFLFDDANCGSSQLKDFNFMSIKSCNWGSFLENWGMNHI